MEQYRNNNIQHIKDNNFELLNKDALNQILHNEVCSVCVCVCVCFFSPAVIVMLPLMLLLSIHISSRFFLKSIYTYISCFLRPHILIKKTYKTHTKFDMNINNHIYIYITARHSSPRSPNRNLRKTTPRLFFFFFFFFHQIRVRVLPYIQATSNKSFRPPSRQVGRFWFEYDQT
jgi:hypothetical protein